MKLNKQEMLERFKIGFSFPPLEVRLAKKVTQESSEADAMLYISQGNNSFDFIAEFSARNTPRAFEDAVRRIKVIAESSPSWPIIVVPYLREERLEDLQRYDVNGIDFCGNGIVSIPGRLFVYRSGKPNKYPESQPSKYAYRGKTSLVARAFLLKNSFKQLADIQGEIRTRGEEIALSTISKAIKRLEEDIIVKRTENEVRLVQQDKLLEKLTESYGPPKISRTISCRAKEPLEKLLSNISSQQKITLSGRSSINIYAVMGRDEYPVIYTTNINSLIKKWANKIEETSRFIDFELYETNDPTVYFDTRIKNNLPYASPVQSYLECYTGDKREQEAALQVRDIILKKQQ